MSSSALLFGPCSDMKAIMLIKVLVRKTTIDHSN
jgi:hypothetical protein